MKVISEVSSNLSMDSAREAARRGDMAMASKFGHYAKNAWKREGKPGMLNPGLHGRGKYGFGIMTPNNTENRFNDDDPHGSEFNTEFKTKPDFTKMSPEEKDDLEYRRQLFGSLYGAIFLDAGNVWAMHHDDSRPNSQFKFKNVLKEMALGTGVGVRYDLDFFVIRLDWGIGLHLPYKSGFYNLPNFKNGQSIHLAIGYPF